MPSMKCEVFSFQNVKVRSVIKCDESVKCDVQVTYVRLRTYNR